MIETLLAELRRRKLWVSNLYEGHDATWRCFLREKRNGRFVSQGTGKTMADAISAALPKKNDDFKDLLG